jgi:acetyl-CoA synthetase
MVHALDVHAGDTMYWVTDMGWMMGPWEVFGMTLLGGTMVLYDGAMDYPGPDRLWSLVRAPSRSTCSASRRRSSAR